MDQTAKRPRGRPRTEAGTPPAYAFRIPKELMEAARTTAEARGENVPDLVRGYLERYVRRHREVPWRGKP